MTSNSSLSDMIGGLQPPPGVVPNFVDPPNTLYGIIVASNLLCVFFATATTVLRLYTKVCLIKTHGWDDYTACIALGGFIVYLGICITTIQYGAGIHQWDVPLPHLVSFIQYANVAELVYTAVAYVVRLSILLQLIKIFVPNHRSAMFYIVQVVIVINSLWFGADFFVSIFQCVPRSKLWDPLVPGYCINYSLYLLIAAVFNVISDLVILLLPIAWIWRLQMSTRCKLEVSAVFAIGSFACIMSILRVILSARNNESGDTTYGLTLVAISCFGELGSGIVCANLPVLPRFFTHLRPKVAAKLPGYFTLSRMFSRTSRSSNTDAQYPAWPKHYRPHLLKDGELELNEQREHGSAIRPLIKGGNRTSANADSLAEGQEGHDFLDLENAFGRNDHVFAIRKTVCLEQSSVR